MKKNILVIVLAAYVFSPTVYLANIESAYAKPKTTPGKKSAGKKKDNGCADQLNACVDVCGRTTASGTKTRDDCVTRCNDQDNACGK